MVPRETTILVVDDLESMRAAISLQLQSLGVDRILLVGDGAEALRILKHQTVDIVLSDWNMPVMNGLELLKAVRTDVHLASLPFVMVTGEADRSRIAELVFSGVSDLLVKPYTTARLGARIEKALRWKRPVNRFLAGFRSGGADVDHGVHEREVQCHAEYAVAKEKNDTRPTILVVDDTSDNLHLISQIFKNDYRVRIAHNGTKALSICCSDDPPDLVLLDIMMPDLDGFEVAQRMREHPNAEMIPVIFVTAMNGDDARLHGLELGAVDFVTKPITPALLKPRVRNFMRYVELRRQLQADYDDMLAAARLREDVEAITRHDLKGPLASVISLAQALVEGEQSSYRQQEMARMIEESTLHVLNMVNLSTDIYAIESGRFVLEPQPVRIGDILRRLVEMARIGCAERRIVITVDTDVHLGVEPPLARGDAMFCYSLFQNLLKNACEAAPPWQSRHRHPARRNAAARDGV